MAKFKLSNVAKEDLVRIHHYGVEKFGMAKADKNFNSFFEYFETIAENPYSLESVDFLKKDYRRCTCGSDSIYYRINHSNVVEIMAIIGKQDLNNLI
ncbi:type II toxin-antitoxin system RelE/ParE family toxin [Wenyingzhuangia sp. IMCC45467]